MTKPYLNWRIIQRICWVLRSLCRWVSVYRSFERTECLEMQGSALNPWIWRHYVPSNIETH